jgi:hypothetical protein
MPIAPFCAQFFALRYLLSYAPQYCRHASGLRWLFLGQISTTLNPTLIVQRIVGQRLKQSGMHWTVSGADAIIALRCTQASSQWEAICSNRHSQTGAA